MAQIIRDSILRQIDAGIDYFGSGEMESLLTETKQEIDKLRVKNRDLEDALALSHTELPKGRTDGTN